MDTSAFPSLIVHEVPADPKPYYLPPLIGLQWTAYGRHVFLTMLTALGFTVTEWPEDYRAAQTWGESLPPDTVKLPERYGELELAYYVLVDKILAVLTHRDSFGRARQVQTYCHYSNGEFEIALGTRPDIYAGRPEAAKLVGEVIGTMLGHPTHIIYGR